MCHHIVWNDDDGVMEKSDDLKLFFMIFNSHLIQSICSILSAELKYFIYVQFI